VIFIVKYRRFLLKIKIFMELTQENNFYRILKIPELV